MSEQNKSRALDSLARKAIEEYKFDFNAPHPEKREFLFSIVEGPEHEYEVGLVSNGGILEIIGKKGSRKTTMLAMLVAACFAEDGIYGNIKSKIGDRTVLWFDTEMPGDDFWYFQKHLHEICGLYDNHPRLFPINMDYFETSEQKLQVILHILRNSNKEGENTFFNDVGFVIIDGIADLISDTGNEAECRVVLDELKSVLNGLDTCLATVLHSDKKGQHSRGTLGTLLDQKATSAIMMDMKNPGEPTIVRPEKIRNGRLFQPYKLEHDVDGSLLIDGVPNGGIQPAHHSAEFMDRTEDLDEDKAKEELFKDLPF